MPERTVTLTPYRVKLGSLYGLTAAGSHRDETVVKGGGRAAGGEAKIAATTEDTKKTAVGSDGDAKQA